MQATSQEWPTDRTFEVAGLGLRLVARILDFIIVVAVYGTVIIATSYGHRSDLQRGLITGALLSAFVIYEVGGVWRYGATLGKRAVGIEVLNVEAAGRLSLMRSIFRFGLFWIVAVATFGLGGLLVALSPTFDRSGRQQGWHDKVAHGAVFRGR